MFTLQLDAQEREILLETLEAAEKQKLHELHHTDKAAYKQLLRDRIEWIERIVEKLASNAAG